MARVLETRKLECKNSTGLSLGLLETAQRELGLENDALAECVATAVMRCYWHHGVCPPFPMSANPKGRRVVDRQIPGGY